MAGTIIPTPGVCIPCGEVGPPGPPGPPGGQFIGNAAETIFQYRVVALNSSGTLFQPSQSIYAETRAVLGIALMSGLIGDPITVQTDGVLVTGALWTPGEYFLGANGILVSTPPTSGNWLQIAFANSATELIVRPQQLVALA